jgi:hypothetical protein
LPVAPPFPVDPPLPVAPPFPVDPPLPVEPPAPEEPLSLFPQPPTIDPAVIMTSANVLRCRCSFIAGALSSDPDLRRNSGIRKRVRDGRSMPTEKIMGLIGPHLH